MTQIAVESPLPTVPAGVLGNPPATDMGAAAAFALAIQLAMGVVTATPAPGVVEGDGQSTDAPLDGSTGAPAGDDEAATDTGATTAAAGTLAALLVPALIPTTATSTATATAASTAASTTSSPDLAPEGAPASPNGTTTPRATPRATTGDTAGGAMDDSALAPAAAADASVATAARSEEAPAEATSPAVPAASDATTKAPSATETASTPAPIPTSPSATAPNAALAPVVTVAGADVQAAPAARPVAAQVIPEVTRLFSNGEGVHRVTLELNPKALGEVRVVLTVRHGDVHVRLAAGSEARAALALSSGDLNRALEHIGIKEHRLTLAELPGVAASAATQTHSDTTESRQQQAPFTGRFDTEQHHDSRQPRMGDGSTATDGTDHEHGSRTRGDRSIHEVSHVPSRGGVDLRM